MAKSPPGREPQQGRIYRDLDGELVRLLEVRKNLCTWVPVSEGEKTRQVTHRDNFLRRFTPFNVSDGKIVA